MAADASRSTSGSSGGGGAADSYLGSLISLTSKSEIRYEGVLFNINTDEASIGLRNVRSFGTEGRRKDGPQVLASDKVYEYIVFRGSDIKDLQVKSSPPVQPAPSVQNDPAIIQSHYTGPSAPSTLPAAAPPAPSPVPAAAPVPAPTGSLSDCGAHIPQSGIPRTTYQNIAPLYPPGGNLAWNPPPPPPINGSGPSVPMYWPGYYGPSASVQTQQQPLLRPVQSLPMQPSLQPPQAQQPAQYPAMKPSVLPGPSNLSPSQSMEFPPPLLQPIVSSTVNMSSTLPVQAVPVVSQGNLPLVSSKLSNMLDKNTAPSLIPNQPKATSGSSMPFNSLSEPLPSVGGTSSLPALVTPGQFLHPGSTIPPTSQMAQKDVEVVHYSLDSPPQPHPLGVTAAPLPVSPSQPHPLGVTVAPLPVSTDTQAPLLPLPTPSNSKVNGVSSQTRFINHRGGRGRGRGRGNEFAHASTNFTEEFDFEAMNERFKKVEMFGESEGTAGDGLDFQELGTDGDVEVAEKKPVYNKDDFFDTLSCNSIDRDSRNGRPRFSEQMNLDTMTFGDFARSRGFRGGRGPGRGGRGRGGYPGRGYGYGYGYGGRGRGQNVYRAI